MEITRLVEESSRKGDFLVRNVQQIFAVLKRHSLIQRMRIPPKAVGVHPANRDGSCIVTQDVHELLDNIAAVGFEPSERTRSASRPAPMQNSCSTNIGRVDRRASRTP